MSLDAYLQCLERDSGTLTKEVARKLADAAWAEGFPTDAIVFEAFALLQESPCPALPPLSTEAQADTQLRTWRQLVAGGTRHLFVRVREDKQMDPRSQRLFEALDALGHGVLWLELKKLESCPDDFVAAAAAQIQPSIEADPPCEAVIVHYDVTQAGRLAPLRHRFTVIYNNPSRPEEGFQARYIKRGLAGTPPPVGIRPSERAPLFSIVIPTRNNAACREHCLQTCLAQDFRDFEIVVGDNSTEDNDETLELIRRLDSKHIRYFKTDGSLALADSFEFAHSRARGEYVLGLGSDDGLLLHGLSTLAKVIETAEHPLDALRFDFVFYGWPCALVPRFRDFIRIPPSMMRKPEGPKLTWLDSRETLERYARYELSFYDVPNGYGYSLLSRRLQNRILEKTGRFYPGNTQDFYTGGYTLCLTERFARLDFPIAVFGTSGASVGAFNTYRGTELNRVRHGFDPPYPPFGIPQLSMIDNEGRDPHYDACTKPEPFGYPPLETCSFTSDEIVNAQSIVDAINRKLLPRDFIRHIDWKRYFERAVQYLYDDDPNFEKKLCEMRARIARRENPELEAWFGQEYGNNPAFKGFPPPRVQEEFIYGLLPNGVLYLDGKDFGVTTVFEAAQLFQRISHL